MAPKPYRSGLEVILPVKGNTPPILDLVLVHGLDGDRMGTWTTETKKFWPVHLLPLHIPDVRILTFGYNGTVNGTTSVAGIREHAQKLLDELRDERENEAEFRSIVFVGHSLGGIIIKQALRFARNKEAFNTIADSTCGIIFFGTPHRGANVSFWTDFVSKVATSTKSHGSKVLPESSMLNDIKANSRALMDISEDFRSICMEFGIVSFWEEDKMEWLGAVVVEKYAARLEIPDEDECMMSGNHLEICKFDEDDTRFSSVWRAIRRLALKSPKAAALIKSERDALSSLCTSDFHLQPMGIDRTPGTCEWIAARHEFRAWRNSTSSDASKLWVSGSPGCGKTYLAKYITEVLEADSKASTVVVPCFLNARRDDRRDGRAILRSTLHRVMMGRRWLVRKFAVPIYDERRRFEEGQHGDKIWTMDILRTTWPTVMKEAAKYFPITLIIDGFDECDDEGQKIFLRALKDFDRNDKENHNTGATTALNGGGADQTLTVPRLKLIIVSRTHPRLCRMLDMFPRLDISPADNLNDITSTVRIATRELARQNKYDPELEDRVRVEITKGAEGMYLWASLMMDDLLHTLPSPKRIKKRLERLPKGILELYDSILGEMSNSKEDPGGNLVKAVLMWVIFGLKVLKVEELGIGLALSEVETHDKDAEDDEDAPEERLEAAVFPNVELTVTHHCGQLVKFSNGSIDLVHRSLAQFLTTPYDTLRKYHQHDAKPLSIPHHEFYYLPSSASHEKIAKYCITYLLLSYFSSSGPPFRKLDPGPQEWREKVRSRVERRRFVEYAAVCLGRHIRCTENAVFDKDNLQVLRNGAREEAICWSEVWWLFEKWPQHYPLEQLRSGLPILDENFGFGSNGTTRHVSAPDVEDYVPKEELAPTSASAGTAQSVRQFGTGGNLPHVSRATEEDIPAGHRNAMSEEQAADVSRPKQSHDSGGTEKGGSTSMPVAPGPPTTISPAKTRTVPTDLDLDGMTTGKKDGRKTTPSPSPLIVDPSAMRQSSGKPENHIDFKLDAITNKNTSSNQVHDSGSGVAGSSASKATSKAKKLSTHHNNSSRKDTSTMSATDSYERDYRKAQRGNLARPPHLDPKRKNRLNSHSSFRTGYGSDKLVDENTTTPHRPSLGGKKMPYVTEGSSPQQRQNPYKETLLAEHPKRPKLPAFADTVGDSHQHPHSGGSGSLQGGFSSGPGKHGGGDFRYNPRDEVSRNRVGTPTMALVSLPDIGCDLGDGHQEQVSKQQPQGSHVRESAENIRAYTKSPVLAPSVGSTRDGSQLSHHMPVPNPLPQPYAEDLLGNHQDHTNSYFSVPPKGSFGGSLQNSHQVQDRDPWSQRSHHPPGPAPSVRASTKSLVLPQGRESTVSCLQNDDQAQSRNPLLQQFPSRDISENDHIPTKSLDSPLELRNRKGRLSKQDQEPQFYAPPQKIPRKQIPISGGNQFQQPAPQAESCLVGSATTTSYGGSRSPTKPAPVAGRTANTSSFEHGYDGGIALQRITPKTQQPSHHGNIRRDEYGNQGKRDPLKNPISSPHPEIQRRKPVAVVEPRRDNLPVMVCESQPQKPTEEDEQSDSCCCC